MDRLIDRPPRRRRALRAPGRVRWLALAVGSTLACGLAELPSADVGASDGTEQDREAVAELRRELGESWERGDLAAFMALVDPDAIALPPSEEALEGGEMIRGWARGEIGRAPWFGRSGEQGLVVRGDVGFAVWPPGPEAVDPLLVDADPRGLEAYRKGSDGRWRLLRLVWNRRSPESGG